MSVELGPLEFTQAHYESLGQMLVAFQHLESVVTHAIILIVEPDFHKKKYFFLPRILEEISFSARLKILSNILATTDVDYFVSSGSKYETSRREEHLDIIAEMNRGISLAEQAEIRRNQLVHSQWLGRGGVLYGPKDTILRIKTRTKAGKSIVNEEYVTAGDIVSIVETMESAEKVISYNAWVLSTSSTFDTPEDFAHPT